MRRSRRSAGGSSYRARTRQTSNRSASLGLNANCSYSASEAPARCRTKLALHCRHYDDQGHCSSQSVAPATRALQACSPGSAHTETHQLWVCDRKWPRIVRCAPHAYEHCHGPIPCISTTSGSRCTLHVACAAVPNTTNRRTHICTAMPHVQTAKALRNSHGNGRVLAERAKKRTRGRRAVVAGVGHRSDAVLEWGGRLIARRRL